MNNIPPRLKEVIKHISNHPDGLVTIVKKGSPFRVGGNGKVDLPKLITKLVEINDVEAMRQKIVDKLAALRLELQHKRENPSASVGDDAVTIGCGLVGLDPIWWNHQIMMSVENLIGDFLELYFLTYTDLVNVDKVLRGVDFWDDLTKTLLQVKNGATSENSSGSKIRLGTAIIKWYRRRPKTKAGGAEKTYWHKIPFPERFPVLSEAHFKEFISGFMTQPQ